MKKISFTLVAAMILAGCAKEVNVDTTQETPAEPAAEVSVSLKASVGDPETRVSSDNFGVYKWQASDKITILTDNGANRTFTTTSAGHDADFDGIIPNTDKLNGGFALYPASEPDNEDKGGHKKSGNTITFNIPREITWSADASNMPMLASITANPQDNSMYNASFKAVGGVLKLILYNIPAEADYLVFVAKTNKISGDYTIENATVTNPVIETEAKTENNNELWINFSENYSSSKVFYIPLPTGTVGGFTVKLYNDKGDELFSQPTKEGVNLSVTANHLIIGPVLNCDPEKTLWSEDFSQYSADEVPGNKDGENYHGASDYTCVNGNSNTMIYDEELAGGASPELLINKNGGSFTANGISSKGITSMTLSFKVNNTIAVNATDGIDVGSVASGSGTKTVTLTNNSNLDSFDLTFSNTSGSNVRIDDISVTSGQPFNKPEINANDEALTIGVGETSANTTISLANALDNLGINAKLSGTNADKFTATIEGNTLTVTAKAANNTDADYTATVTLKATGADAKEIAITQKTPATASEYTYIFTSKTWGATRGEGIENWTSGKDGNQLTADRGIQITTGVTGANGTSPYIFTDVEEVTVTYSTNGTTGAGNIKVKVGNGTAKSSDVGSSTGGTTDRELKFDYTTKETGLVNVEVTCSQNSIYIKSVTIKALAIATPHTIACASVSNGSIESNKESAAEGETVTLTATPESGYNFVAWDVYKTDDISTKVQVSENQFTMPAYNVTVSANFVAIPKHTLTLTAPGNGNAIKATVDEVDVATSTTSNVSVEVEEGADVTISVPTTAPGYAFNSWAVSGATVSGSTFKMGESDVTVTANFTTFATISVTNPIEIEYATADTYIINNAYILLNGATSDKVTVSDPDNTVVTAVSKGNSDGSICITVNGNTGAARSGYFNIKYGDEVYRTITVNQVAGSSTPAVGTVLFAETFGSEAVNPFSSYTGTGSSSYHSESTLSYTCKSNNTKIMNDTQGDCGPANLLVGGNNGGVGEWAKISGIKTYGATKVTVTWASNGSVVQVSIAESSSAAVTSAASASNSGTFTLSGEEETITLVMTAGSKKNGRVDTIQITVAE